MKTKTGLIIILSLLLVFLISNVKQSKDVATKPPTTVISLQTSLEESPTIKKAIIVKLEGEVTQKWALTLEKAFSTPFCDIVVAWIESPGGGVTETQVLEHRIEILKEKYKKHFVVYIEQWCQSGCYWIACEADAIIISPVASVGSIGVYIERPDLSKYNSNIGVDYYIFRSGNHKAMGNPNLPMTPEEAEYLEKLVKDAYVQFCAQVYIQRYKILDSLYFINNRVKADSVTILKEVLNFSDGRPFSSNDALKLGLVDRVEYLDHFISELNLQNIHVEILEE